MNWMLFREDAIPAANQAHGNFTECDNLFAEMLPLCRGLHFLSARASERVRVHVRVRGSPRPKETAIAPAQVKPGPAAATLSQDRYGPWLGPWRRILSAVRGAKCDVTWFACSRARCFVPFATTNKAWIGRKTGFIWILILVVKARRGVHIVAILMAKNKKNVSLFGTTKAAWGWHGWCQPKLSWLPLPEMAWWYCCLNELTPIYMVSYLPKEK